eukprot:GHVS01091547.1.p1 GENE.GHVS01091547.1~~GHVS01091547.1.p1  ORF type:complete len:584 (-),score=188.57 GHVS01091547.1:545-2230(-)
MKRSHSPAPLSSTSSSSSSVPSFSLFGPPSCVSRSAQFESSPALLGRSRAERLLDRAYSHQSQVLLKQQHAKRRRFHPHSTASSSSRRTTTTTSSRPSSTGTTTDHTAGGNSQPSSSSSSPVVDPLAALTTLLFRHLPQRAKYSKAVELIVKLIQSTEVFVSEEERRRRKGGENKEEEEEVPLKTEEAEDGEGEGEGQREGEGMGEDKRSGETESTPIDATFTSSSSSLVPSPVSPSSSSSASNLPLLIKTEPQQVEPPLSVPPPPPPLSALSYKAAFLCAIHHILVVQQHCAITVAQSRPTINELFEQILLPLCYNQQNTTTGDGGDGGGGVLDEEEVEYVRVLSLCPSVLYRLQTDDTYTFTSAVGALKTHITLLKKQVQDNNMRDKISSVEEETDLSVTTAEKQCEKEAEEIVEVSPRAADIVKDEEAAGGGRSTNHRDELLDWRCPTGSLLLSLRRQFIFECLHAAFRYHQTSWAKASVEGLFQQAYLDRDIFDRSQQEQITTWQGEIKAKHKGSNKFHNVSAYGIGEAKNPVRDGRDDRISTLHGSIVWSSKQMGL